MSNFIVVVAFAISLVSLGFSVSTWLRYSHDLSRMFDSLSTRVTKHHDFMISNFNDISEVFSKFDDRITSLEREIDIEEDM